MHEPSNGWDDVADKFIELRSDIGCEIVAEWSRSLPARCAVLDLGCGHGEPISALLQAGGFDVHGVEASPKLAAEFIRRLPGAHIRCEAAETSGFFEKSFDAAIAIGLMFLLSPEIQHQLIRRVANALNPGGRFLFTAPIEIGEWDDLLTGQTSWSLGEEEYTRTTAESGLDLVATHVDGGGNNYYDLIKDPGR